MVVYMLIIIRLKNQLTYVSIDTQDCHPISIPAESNGALIKWKEKRF